MTAPSEPCLRCGARMEWRHQTWQCPRCRFKLGCCEGDDVCAPASAEPASDVATVRSAGRPRDVVKPS